MPAYPYRCTNCDTEFEVQRSMLHFASPAQCSYCSSWETKRTYGGINVNLRHLAPRPSSTTSDQGRNNQENEPVSTTPHDEVHEERPGLVRIENSTDVKLHDITLDGGWDGIQSFGSEISLSNLSTRRLKGSAVYARNSRIKMRDAEFE